MDRLLATSSHSALAATSPDVRQLGDVVELRLLYNAFAPEEVEIHELVWRENTTLSDYLEGLPPEAEWMVFFNGEEVELEDAPNIPVAKHDRIGLVLIPQGGNGFKSILRIALQLVSIAM